MQQFATKCNKMQQKTHSKIEWENCYEKESLMTSHLNLKQYSNYKFKTVSFSSISSLKYSLYFFGLTFFKPSGHTTKSPTP